MSDIAIREFAMRNLVLRDALYAGITIDEASLSVEQLQDAIISVNIHYANASNVS